MKNRFLVLALGLVTVALLPTVVHAGNGFGACLVYLAEEPMASPVGGNGNAIVCADGLDAQQCDSFCGDESSPEGGLIVVGCEWASGFTCEGVADKSGEPWDGACDLGPNTPVGDLCVVINESLANWTSEEVCISGEGMWLGDGTTCGAPVPALPRVGQAVLMVVLMLGALVILNLSGILRSA